MLSGATTDSGCTPFQSPAAGTLIKCLFLRRRTENLLTNKWSPHRWWGFFWGEKRWGWSGMRWISEVIRDDIFQRLQSASKKQWSRSLPARKVIQEPWRLQALASFFLAFIVTCAADNSLRLYVIIHWLSPWGTWKCLTDRGVNGKKVAG